MTIESYRPGVSPTECPNGCGKLDEPSPGVLLCPFCLWSDFSGAGGGVNVARPSVDDVRRAVREEGE